MYIEKSKKRYIAKIGKLLEDIGADFDYFLDKGDNVQIIKGYPTYNSILYEADSVEDLEALLRKERSVGI